MKYRLVLIPSTAIHRHFIEELGAKRWVYGTDPSFFQSTLNEEQYRKLEVSGAPHTVQKVTLL
jgi:hypothetical protein